MLRRVVSAAAVLLVLAGFVVAETYTGVITKISDKELTATVRKKGEKGKGEEKTFKVSSKVKITKGKDTEIKVADVNEIIEKAKGKVKGAFATIEVEDDQVTSIKIGAGKGKGKKKDG